MSTTITFYRTSRTLSHVRLLHGVLPAGAAAGGGSVRGDEVKECLMAMVGRAKAKQEACFALEQIVFRAVLTG
jgi:hypothetical protein